MTVRRRLADLYRWSSIRGERLENATDPTSPRHWRDRALMVGAAVSMVWLGDRVDFTPMIVLAWVTCVDLALLLLLDIRLVIVRHRRRTRDAD